MFYRVVIVANFQHEPTPDSIHRVINYLNTHAININPGSTNAEPTTAKIELCHHDENPTEPCTLIRSWELPDS